MKFFAVVLVLLAIGGVACAEEATGAAAVTVPPAADFDADNLPWTPSQSEEAVAESEESEADETGFNAEESDESEATDSIADENEEEASAESFSLAELETDIAANANAAAAAQAQAQAQAAGQAQAEAAAQMQAQAQAQAQAEAEAAAAAVAEGKPRAPPARMGGRGVFKYHPERVEASSTNRMEDPEMGKLNLALAAVKEDILSTNKQITDERKWVIAVAKIIASYNDKMKRVEAHIIALRKEMKRLYKKKKQIENLKLQKALEAKLREARAELKTLTESLKHVAVKSNELNRSGAELRTTIAGIQAQLAKLRGQQMRVKPKRVRRCRKGFRFSKKSKKCVRKGRKGRKARAVRRV